MALTAEIRWFWPHATPSAFAVWFRSSVHHGCMVGGGRSCTGTHLPWDGHPRWDIRRQGGSISVRAHQTTLEDGCRLPPFGGDITIWFDLISKHEPPPGAVPVDVVGRRWLRQFDTSGVACTEIRLGGVSSAPPQPGPHDSPSCLADLAEFELGDFGGRWATFGLTAFGPADTLAASINATAGLLRERHPPDLEDAFVTTMPQWILSLSPFWRHSAALRHARSTHPAEHDWPPPAPHPAGF
ncbi:hypothetical protein AACH06_24710 [Ideonella sp. DXS29W]|uniref:Uncharacterized protein n=1 Tax=Ideonella lacteola TaxID=2984193 RepID=A0ABU9BX95_9BURK